MRNILVLGTLGGLLGGCLASPFVRNDGPVQAAGVTLSLMDQRCSVDSEDWNTYEDTLDLGMRVAVRNGTQQPISVTPGNFRLMAGRLARPPISPPAARQIAPGGTEIIAVEFRRPGDGRCDEEMSLAVENAVRVGGEPVSLKPVTFVASAGGG
jgi:hypothetical protein